MSTHDLYFHDNDRLAAEHLLDSATTFGARLRQLVKIEADESYGYLAVHLQSDTENYLSSGELVLLDVLESLAGQGHKVDLTALWRVDDATWARVMQALGLARGCVVSS